MNSYTCIVEGTVAGGKFQSWVRDAAEQLGLTGWVRNIGHNKAEILIQGTAEAYAKFRERLKTEPPVTDLVNVTCHGREHDKTFETFETRG